MSADRHTRTVHGAAGHAARSGWAEAVRKGDVSEYDAGDEYPDVTVDLTLHDGDNESVAHITLGWFRYVEEAQEFFDELVKYAPYVAEGRATYQ